MRGAPVVALVDAGSASATEVLSARCATRTGEDRGQPHLRQGPVQTLLPLDNGDRGQAHHRALLHAQRQVDPSVGIVPDVVLKPDKATADKGRGGRRRALHRSFVPGHL